MPCLYTRQNLITNGKNAISQAASYGKQLRLAKIALVFFVETIDDDSRKRYETGYEDRDTGVTVEVIFVATGT